MCEAVAGHPVTMYKRFLSIFTNKSVRIVLYYSTMYYFLIEERRMCYGAGKKGLMRSRKSFADSMAFVAAETDISYVDGVSMVSFFTKVIIFTT